MIISDLANNTTSKNSTPSQLSTESTIPSAEIQLIINHKDTNPETIPSVKIILPDGKVIEAEIVVEDSGLQQASDENKINNSLKDLIFNTTTLEQDSQIEDLTDSIKSQPGSIKNLLTAIADKIFSKAAIEAMPEANRSNIAKMIINEITLPVLLSEPPQTDNPTASLHAMTKEIGITLPYLDIGDAISDILSSSSNLSLSQTSKEEYTLKYTASNGQNIEIPVPQGNNEAIQQALSTLTPSKTGTPSPNWVLKVYCKA